MNAVASYLSSPRSYSARAIVTAWTLSPTKSIDDRAPLELSGFVFILAVVVESKYFQVNVRC